jgi:two-component system phosphate regulon sensor histidine kinase PhoR
MKFSIRSRIFVVSVALILIVGTISAVYLESELKQWLESRVESDLLAHASTSMALLDLAPGSKTIDDFDLLADKLGKHQGRRITLIAKDGTVLGDSMLPSTDVRDMQNHQNRPEVLQANRVGRGIERRVSDTVGRRYLYVAVPFEHPLRPGVLRIAEPLEEVERTVDRMRLFFLFAGALGLCLAILVSLLASHLLSRRLRSLLTRAKAMADGHDSTAITKPEGVDEISILHRSLDRLDEALEDIVTTLAVERDRFEAVLEGMQEAVLVVNSDRRITLGNKAALDYFELKKTPRRKRVHKVIKSKEILAAIDAGLRGESSELDIEIDRGDTRFVMGRVAPHGNESGCVLVLHDITRLRKLERVRRDFVANVSHELRTPVSVIQLNAEALRDGAMNDPITGPKFLDALVRNAERLAHLISDLLHISRIESGKYDMDPATLKIHDVIDTVTESIEQLAAQKNISIEQRVKGTLLVRADRFGLEHALLNLVQNAVRYTQEGGKVECLAMKSGDGVRIEVRDNGPGIPENHQKRIFERFYRVDKGRSKHMGGTGLGLSIVKHLIRNMDGEIGMVSNDPEGCIFWLELPGPETALASFSYPTEHSMDEEAES